MALAPRFASRGSLRLLAACAVALTLVAVASARVGATTTLEVTTAADLPWPCSTQVSLRCAIDQANRDGSGDTIAFSIPATSQGCAPTSIQGATVAVCELAPTTGLPPLIATNTVIDGFTQPGARSNTNPPGAPNNAILTISLNGQTCCAQHRSGLQIAGSHNTVRGLSINNFGGQGLGAQAIGIGSPTLSVIGTAIEGNFLGVDPTGVQPPGVGNGYGVVVDTSASSTVVGGLTPAEGNIANSIIVSGPNTVVQGNLVGMEASGAAEVPAAAGIQIQRTQQVLVGGTTAAARNVVAAGVFLTSATNITIQGNYIGTDVTGSRANGTYNIGLQLLTSSNVLVGGTAPGAGNLISGHNQGGIEISESSNNVVQQNLVGTDASGTKVIGNGQLGIWDQRGNANVIGGTSVAARNVFSGNGYYGVELLDTVNDVVQGNFIGTDSSGLRALANGQGGILLDMTDPTIVSGSLVGGNTVGAGNLISANSGYGVVDEWSHAGAVPATTNQIIGNRIGTNASGTAPLGNGLDGVFVNSSVSGDTVQGNVIAYNNGAGIHVGQTRTDVNVHVSLSRNLIWSNAGLGIDLAPLGHVDCTGPSAGPNDYTPCPVILTATTGTVTGTACAGCQVEVFQASAVADDLSHGEGAIYMGSAVANTAGAWSLSLVAGQVTSGELVTATATTGQSPLETSEFGANVAVK
jgi:titin